jgi:hypothetical protein
VDQPDLSIAASTELDSVFKPKTLSVLACYIAAPRSPELPLQLDEDAQRLLAFQKVRASPPRTVAGT